MNKMYDKLKHMILEEYDRNPPEIAYTNCVAVFTREWVKGTINRDNYEDLQFMNEERYDEELGLNEEECKMKKVNEMSHIELIEEVEKLRCERDMYKNLNRTHVEKVNNITKELGKVNILTHEVDHYKDMVDMKKKEITRMTYRIEELENENEALKYNLDVMAKENYEIKKRCNDLSYDLVEIRNYCDSVLNDEDEEEE